MLIYFAGPLFSDAEKRFNLELTERLEHSNFQVFLPQRDGVESDKPPYDTMGKEERRKALFKLDKSKVFEADIFLFILDGRIPDEGACVELGLAHAQREVQGTQKLLLGLHTDVRAAFLGSKLNPMLRMALDQIVESEAEVLGVLEKYRGKFQ